MHLPQFIRNKLKLGHRRGFYVLCVQCLEYTNHQEFESSQADIQRLTNEVWHIGCATVSLDIQSL